MAENREMFNEVIDQEEDINLRKQLVEEVKSIPSDADWNTISSTIQNLKRRWRRINYWESALEDSLEEEFEAAVDALYSKRNAVMANSKVLKEELIARAKTVAETNNFNQGTNEMNELLNQWKAAGSCGKETDDALWEQFNAARQAFYDARNAHFDAQRAENAKRAEAKAELVKAAQAIADEKFYSRENSDKIKNLNAQWKTIGFAGKEQEDALWAQFRAAADSYFEGLKQYNQSRRDQWMMRMQENRARKLDLIAKQKNQLKRMEQELGYILSQSAVDEMKEDIEDKKAFIAELEEELAELDKRIAE